METRCEYLQKDIKEAKNEEMRQVEGVHVK